MYRNDPLFFEFDQNTYKAYKDADLLNYRTYSDYLNDVQKYASIDRPNTVDEIVNPLKIVKYGPATNIAGRYLNYITGSSKNLNTTPREYYGFDEFREGTKVVKSPTTRDLALGWALAATDGMLYPD